MDAGRWGGGCLPASQPRADGRRDGWLDGGMDGEIDRWMEGALLSQTQRNT